MMNAEWRYLTIDELIAEEQAIWLFYKRWDGGELVPTAVNRLNYGDDGQVYSIGFFSGNVQIAKGYGVYWWVTDRKPDPTTLEKWGCKDAEKKRRFRQQGLSE